MQDTPSELAWLKVDVAVRSEVRSSRVAAPLLHRWLAAHSIVDTEIMADNELAAYCYVNFELGLRQLGARLSVRRKRV